VGPLVRNSSHVRVYLQVIIAVDTLRRFEFEHRARDVID
jgi:hypothetical protein